MPPRQSLALSRAELIALRIQVKQPKFDEIVTLTLPDGMERSGRVLEVRGTL